MHSARSSLDEAAPAARGLGSRWYVAETDPRKETVAVENLERQSFRCFSPQIQKIRRHAGRSDIVLVPLFPGYVFVNFDVEHGGWCAINGTRGVRRLLTSNPLTPVPMPTSAMASLLQRYCGRKASQAVPDVQVGDSVLIVSGPFAEQYAKVEAIDDKGRVRLLFDILGGGASVSVDVSNVASLHEEPGR